MDFLSESVSAQWVIKCTTMPNAESNDSVLLVHKKSPMTTYEVLSPGDMQCIAGRDPGDNVIVIPLDGQGNLMTIQEAFSKGYIKMYRKYD